MSLQRLEMLLQLCCWVLFFLPAVLRNWQKARTSFGAQKSTLFPWLPEGPWWRSQANSLYLPPLGKQGWQQLIASRVVKGTNESVSKPLPKQEKKFPISAVFLRLVRDHQPFLGLADIYQFKSQAHNELCSGGISPSYTSSTERKPRWFFFMRLMPSQRVAGCGCGEPQLPGAAPAWLGGTAHRNGVVLSSGWWSREAESVADELYQLDIME